MNILGFAIFNALDAAVAHAVFVFTVGGNCAAVKAV